MLIILVQLLYPGNRLLPFTKLDNVAVSGWKKQDAARELNKQSKAQPIAIYFGAIPDPYQSPKPEAIGLSIDYSKQVDALNYPWYMRLIPTSLLWAQATQRPNEPEYVRNNTVLDAFITKSLGNSCDVKPKDASLVAKDDKLRLVPSTNGGTCKIEDVKKALASVKPTLATKPNVKIKVKVVLPNVSDSTAKKLAEQLNVRVGKQVVLKVNDTTQAISAKEVLQWLAFAPKENELVVSVNKDRANTYLAKEVTPKLTKAAGVTKVTTSDFTETGRQAGADGQTLGIDATLTSFMDFLNKKNDQAQAVPQAVPATLSYTRSYTPTSVGITALITHYAQTHSGTYGVSFVELTGAGRSADFNSTNSFITASTYKLFVAYGTLKRVESGEWKWADQIAGGRDLAACLDDMIVKSDNACGEAMLKKIGYTTLTNEIRGIGLGSSGFTGDNPRTTSSNLTLFLTKLETSQLGLKPESRDRLLSAMKRNIYVRGIPSGANGDVADKVGFLDGLLHDAAIVYSPSGTYALTIMTDGSTWANIAELTRQIEALRIQ